jgi:putative GTP pyrophosphokinase
MSSSNQNADLLDKNYRRRHENALRPIAAALQELLADCLKDQPRIDRISARPKDPESFIIKAKKRASEIPRYSEPLDQIQDQIGCRIITFFLADVTRIGDHVLKYFRAIEYKDHIPDSEWEFGYFGRHYVVLLPDDVVEENLDRS